MNKKVRKRRSKNERDKALLSIMSYLNNIKKTTRLYRTKN